MSYRHIGVALVVAVAAGTIGGAAAQVTMGTTGRGVAPERMEQILGELAGIPGSTAKPLEVGPGIILGRVTDGVDGSGIAGAIVTLSLAGHTPLRVQASTDGRFAFRALPIGTYSLTSARPGYGDGAAGRTQPGGPSRSVTLTDAQRFGETDILMWRYAALAGTVLDEHNEPMVGVQVRALRRDYSGGRRRLTMGPSDTTDDRGQYRISALEAGDYIVALPMIQRPSLDALIGGARDGAGGAMVATRVAVVASTSAGAAPVVVSSLDGGIPPAGTTDDGRPLTYQTEFFTGAVSAARATVITVGAGEERTGIDFAIRPVPALNLSGTVMGPDGPTSNVQLQLMPMETDDLVSPIEVATTSSDATGGFTFEQIPAGQYVLRAQRQSRGGGETFQFTQGSGNATFTVRQTVERAAQAAPLPDTPNLWAETTVVVGGRDINDVGITLREGLTVNGTVSFNGTAPAPPPEQRGSISILLEPADGRTAELGGIVRGRVDANGTFTTMGVPRGKYILRVSGIPQGWTLRDASFGGRDITSTAVELDTENANGVLLTFVDRPTELNGSVRDGSGNVDQRASVVIFPVNQALWTDTGAQPRRLRQIRATQDGQYRITGLPAGDYYVLAVDDSAPRQWQDPAVLAEFSRSATTVRLADGDIRTYALTTQKGGR